MVAIGSVEAIRIVGVDPGPIHSAWIWVCGSSILEFGYCENETLLNMAKSGYFGSSTHCAIEMVANYGMPAGRDLFETARTIGMIQHAFMCAESETRLLYRKATSDYFPSICDHICKSPKASDANIRKAILDMYPPTGGGSVPQVGVKKRPGPLFGVSTHVWQALAVAITYRDNVRP